MSRSKVAPEDQAITEKACPTGNQLRFAGTKKVKSKSGFESEVCVYHCMDVEPGAVSRIIPRGVLNY